MEALHTRKLANARGTRKRTSRVTPGSRISESTTEMTNVIRNGRPKYSNAMVAAVAMTATPNPRCVVRVDVPDERMANRPRYPII